MKIGVVVAEESEVMPMLTLFGQKNLIMDKMVFGFRSWMWHIDDKYISVVLCGAGEIGAAAATQMLVSFFGAQLIVNIGVCGGLTDDAGPLSRLLVNGVYHYDHDTSTVTGRPVGAYPGMDRYLRIPDEFFSDCEFTRALMWPKAICASGDKFIADPLDKRRLSKESGAKICDMEAAGVLLTAQRAGVPAIIVKIVSDSTDGGADEFNRTLTSASDVCASSLGMLLEVNV